jgi:membrane-associated phospholipid phosphatase
VRCYWNGSVQLLLGALLLLQPVSASAQTDVLSQSPKASAIRWYHGAIALGALTLLLQVDEPIDGFIQDRRSKASDDLASSLRHFGQPEVYGTITLGMIGSGLIGANPELTRAGGRLATTLALSALTAGGIKLLLGRPRPDQSSDIDGFVPFSGQEAMPSGHTAMAFALATALADEIHSSWASVGLYTLATGVGWSRLNDNRHWLSDVGAGAVIGITSARLVNGRWRLFDLRPPSILLGPRHAGLAWQISF